VTIEKISKVIQVGNGPRIVQWETSVQNANTPEMLAEKDRAVMQIGKAFLEKQAHPPQPAPAQSSPPQPAQNPTRKAGGWIPPTAT
jgi:hypothetical protein